MALTQSDLTSIRAIVQQELAAALPGNNTAAAEAVWQRVGSGSETMGKKLGDVDNRAQNVETTIGTVQQDVTDIKAHLGI